MSSWQVRQSRLCQNEKEQSRQSRAPDRKGGESLGEQEPHLGEKEGDQSESTERKGWTLQWKKGRFQGGDGGRARRASLREVERSISG